MQLERQIEEGNRGRHPHRVRDRHRIRCDPVLALHVPGKAHHPLSRDVAGDHDQPVTALGRNVGIHARVGKLQVCEGVDAPGVQLLCDEVAQGITAIERMIDQLRQGVVDERNRQPLPERCVEKARVVGVEKQLMQCRGADAGCGQRPHQRARRRARDALETVAGILKGSESAHEGCALDPSAFEHKVGSPWFLDCHRSILNVQFGRGGPPCGRPSLATRTSAFSRGSR